MNEPHQYSEQDVEDALMRNAYAEGRKDEREAWLPVLEALRRIDTGIVGAEANATSAAQWRAEMEAVKALARAAIQKAEGTT